jgi:opacity protein-like surface antigen
MIKRCHFTSRGLGSCLKPALFAISLLIAIQIYAQENDSAEKIKTAYGLKAGVNFAELWGEDAIPESDRKTGYSFGAFASFKLSENFTVQPEAIWSLQGESSESNGRYKISYLNIPVMFKWKKGRFYAEVGPQLGILTVNTSKSVPDELRLEDFETFDLTVNAGVGFQLFEDWSIGLRYGEGLTNIAPGRDLRNSVIYLGVAYTVF